MSAIGLGGRLYFFLNPIIDMLALISFGVSFQVLHPYRRHHGCDSHWSVKSFFKHFFAIDKDAYVSTTSARKVALYSMVHHDFQFRCACINCSFVEQSLVTLAVSLFLARAHFLSYQHFGFVFLGGVISILLDSQHAVSVSRLRDFLF